MLRTAELQNNSTLLRAVSLERLHRYEESIQELEELVGLEKPGPVAYAALGGRLADVRRDLNGAATVLSEGHEKFPRDPGIINNLAYVRLLKGEISSARELLESAPKHSNSSVFLLATWGLVRLKEGNVKEGNHDYQEAEKLASQIGNRQLAKAVRQKMHLESSRHYFEERDYMNAWNEVRLGLREKDGSVFYLRDLGELEREILQVCRSQDLPSGA